MAEAKYCQEFGRRFREIRKLTGLTLRKFCHKHGFDHSNLSKVERGRLKPPTGKKLKQYLDAMGVEAETDEWYELHDMAAACAGEVPEPIMRDEELVKKLPVVFSTLQRERPTEEDLKKLIDIIRES